MEKFVNITSGLKEKAFKIGNSVPSGSIGLSWFSAKEISPANNIVIVDLSETILENRSTFVQSDNEAFLAYADELGFLRTIDGSYTFNSDDVSISNVFMNKETTTGAVDISSINPNDFVHNYYISKFFIMASYAFNFSSLRQYEVPERFKDIKIKVIDRDGNDYVDSNTGRRKYRILLEPFKTTTNYNRPEIPCRVIVLFDATYPSGLKLIYDKVECDYNGNSFNMQISYQESVNSVELFQTIPEEAFVIDNNYRTDNKYSIKKINQKYSDLVSDQKVENGYQIVTPSKGLDDNRSFEVFNWRLIARTRNSINLNEINKSSEFNPSQSIIAKTFKVGVLYSSQSGETNTTCNPYVFNRLSNSPFNLTGFSFINPLKEFDTSTSDPDKKKATYWKIDIDSDNLNLNEFDLVVWSPAFSITLSQARKILEFTKNNGTILLDLSNGADAGLLGTNINLNKTPTRCSYTSVNDASVLIDPNKNGGWDLQFNSDLFEKDYYGIFGSNKFISSNTYKSYRRFTGYPTGSSFMDGGTNSDSASSLGLVIPVTSPNASELVSGNIIAVSFPLLSYCNDIYSVDGTDIVIDENTQSVDSSIRFGSYIYPGIVEGPFKLLFNIVSYAAYCRTSASRVKDIKSSLFNYVSDWNSAWVMDQAVLLADEKSKYFKDIPNMDQLGVDLISVDSLDSFYKTGLSSVLPEFHKDKVFGFNSANVEFFIEVTNPDVEISNSTKIDTSNLSSENEGIPSSYYLFKITNNNVKPFAYTLKQSASLTVPDGIGPYAIIDKTISSSNSKVLNDKLNILGSFKSYPFNLTSSYTYSVGSEESPFLDANVSLNFDMVFKGTAKRKSVTYVTNPPTNSTHYVRTTINCENFVSTIDDLKLKATSSKSSFNAYLYSGDIDIHNDARLWKSGMSHEYVKYIQYTVAVALGINVKVDGSYGPKTAAAVKQFQVSGNQRYLDGTVDSETKSFLAFFWKKLKISDLSKYNDLKAWAAGNPDTASVVKYIKATNTVGFVSEIGTKTYKKISFSGFGGPNQAEDFIFFKIPSKIKKVNKIIIKADDDVAWKNFSIIQYGYTNLNIYDIFKTTNFAPNRAAVNGKVEISLNGIDADKARYMWIEIRGKGLPGYGYAEGFSIQSIEVDGEILETVTTPGSNTPVTVEDTYDIWALAKVTVKDLYRGINISTPFIKEYSTTALPVANSFITDLYIGCNNQGDTTKGSPFPSGQVLHPTLSSPIPLDKADYSNGSYTQFFGFDSSFDFTNPTKRVKLTYSSGSVTSVSDAGKTLSTSTISLSNSGLTVRADTSVDYYATSGTHVKLNRLSSGFRLKNLQNRLYPSGTNTIDITDGILLLCGSNGQNFGFPSSSEILSSLDAVNAKYNSEIDARYGILSVSNSLETNGLIYGFYDISKNEMLGKTLLYIEYINRGPSNIFISVCAIDADGNTRSSNDFIGPKTSTLFKPVNLPLKSISPIYSIKTNNSTSIRVGGLDPEISKFDVWELPVSSGSFWKTINISNKRSWPGWKKEYLGQDLFALYTTESELMSSWSKIYGTGFYDVIDETPVILDERSIRLRRVPLMNVWYPTDNFDNTAGIIRQEINIYTKASVASPWVEVSKYNIKDIDSESGIVQFRTAIVPSNSSLIKVSYVSASKYNLVKQVGGTPIPLNPLLNSESINFDQPLYIYLMPKVIYKKDTANSGSNNFSMSSNKIRVSEYSFSSVLNFTYDDKIFDSRSSKFDPFALPIAIVYVTNNPYFQTPDLTDVRLRGGGVVVDHSNSQLQDSISGVLSHWDVYPPSGEAYTKGGYVIIRIPKEVKDHFLDEKEIYRIISNNLTAGIAYELQDMDGNSWN
jgi:peptidoglycan hydrolase-like protein with peptidoglycan-binding domain